MLWTVLIVIAAIALLVALGAVFLLRGGDEAVPDVDELDAPPLAPPDDEALDDVVDIRPEVDLAEPEAPPRATFRDRLGKARGALAGYLGSVLSRGVDQQTWDELEEALIRADVGVAATSEVLEVVRTRATEAGTVESAEVIDLLKAELVQRLGGRDTSLTVGDAAPSVWLFVGVNGVGKTTTIGKLAKRETAAGRSVVLAAGDTFRAAAAEQLTTWAERSGAGIIRGAEGSDPSAVIFDAVEHAAARDVELVLADTAGRLHTKVNLMEELRKVRRVAEKGAGTVTEVLLVLDATTGQNGLVQATQFTEAVDVTGVVLTKLDGSAKGGIVLAVQSELDIPVKLVGLGEGVDDLIEFDANDFVEALFA